MATGVMQQYLQKQQQCSNDLVPDWLNAEHLTGTTLIAVEYDEGVVVGADSRTSTGTYVANRVTDKLTKISENIYCCRSGSAADTQAVADIVSYQLEFLKQQLGDQLLVKTAASLLQDMCYQYRDQLMAGIICAGWDAEKGGQVYSVPIGGMCHRQPITIGGSGSTYLYGYVDATFKEKMNVDECKDFVTKAITLAINRDGSSGGIARLAVINKDGVQRSEVLHEDLPKFYMG